jgi:TRAP-type C4-dicarboxylate transport system permease small subunit
LRFRLLSENIAKLVEWIGVAGVLFMLLVTVIDVIGAKIFLNPLRGATEIIGFAQIVAISCTIAVGLFLGRHISIEFFVDRIPGLVQKGINLFISSLGLILFILLSRKSYTYGLSLKKAGEISSTAYIPFYPFAFVITICAAVSLLYFLNEILSIFTDRSGKNGTS